MPSEAPTAASTDTPSTTPAGRTPLTIERRFTAAGVDPLSSFSWERRDSRIVNPDGSVVFELTDVEVPTHWDQGALDIVASKYFRKAGVPQVDENGNLRLGDGGAPVLGPERSVRQVAHRLANAWRVWGERGGYFATADDAQAFYDELLYMIVAQMSSPNSPQWFNTGLFEAYGITAEPEGNWYVDPDTGEARESEHRYERSAANACFILSPEDELVGEASIMRHWENEARLFKSGSGSGGNYSKLREAKAPLSAGGTSSGVMSFLKVGDVSAGSIKCLPSGTPIATPSGVRAIDALTPGDEVLTRSGPRTVLEVHDNGIRPVVRVATAIGLELTSTPEHRFLVRSAEGTSFATAAELDDGDFLVLDLSAQPYGTPQSLRDPGPGHHNEVAHSLPTHLDERFALWLGMISGDGSITSVPGTKFIALQVADDDADVVDRYKKLTAEIFGGGTHFFSNRPQGKPDRSQSVRFCSSQVIRFLEVNGLRKEPGSLTVPAAVQSSPAAVRAAFLSGLFTTDGTVESGYPCLSTAHQSLAVDVQRELLALGIPAKITRTERTSGFGHSPNWRVRVVGSVGVRRFMKIVGFECDQKDQRLRSSAKAGEVRYETQWVLPHAVEILNDHWASGSPELRRALSPYCRVADPTALSLVAARRLIDRFPGEFDESEIGEFAEGTRYYVAVESVVDAGEAETWDITVEDVHEYLVSSVVTHNSGGTTRRAAKMVILDADHPDVEEFIWCKVREEEKVAALVAGGYSADWQGEAYETVAFQNANHSVRLPAGFMASVASDGEWSLLSRVDGSVVRRVRARDLWHQIAEAAWRSADPGVQFDDILNDWNTVADTERVRGTNPCCFVGDTLVQTDAGRVTIADLAARAATGRRLGAALALDTRTGEANYARITNAWVAGVTSRLIDVATASGHVLRCTPEHRFLVDGSRWVPAAELASGDLLASVSAPGAAGADKVSTVTEVSLEEPVQVYDIEVAKYHNFAVLGAGDAPGVIAHNSEFTHVDNTACNLASLNLGAFYSADERRFDVDGFVHACRLWTAVLEITVAMSHYPTRAVAEKSYEHRPLGLGVANLGATLMRAGLAYDSDQGRAAMGAMTALLHTVAYTTSAELAAAVGPADAFAANRDSALRVLRNHRRAAYGSLAGRHGLGGYEGLTVEPMALDHLTLAHTPFADLSPAVTHWADQMVSSAENNGLRNLQVSLAAPTGTISFIMGCDTTGIEPDFSLVKFKKLAGGGYMRIVNGSVPAALSALGYNETTTAAIMNHVLGTRTLDGPTELRATTLADAGFTAAELDRARVALVNASVLTEAFEPWAVGEDVYTRLGVEPAAGASALLAAAGFDAACVAACSKVICGHATTEGAPGLRPEHAAVFDCAVECGDGTRVVSAEGHVRALGAIAPFLSGSASKTVNLPSSATVEDIEATHDLAYRLGVKCVAVYRDGSKLSQPLSAAGRSSAEETVDEVLQLPTEIPAGMSPAAFYHGTTPPRFRLPDVRPGLTWRFTVGGEEVYLRSGEYEDGSLGEVFIDWGRQGSTLRGITGALSIMISQALQHGVPLEKVVGSLRGHMFEPAGIVSGHANLRMATSLVDAIVRILGHHYLGRNDLVQVPSKDPVTATPEAPTGIPAASAPNPAPQDGPPATAPVEGERVIGKSCTQCGSEALVRTGSCNTCTSCGSTTGCA